MKWTFSCQILQFHIEGKADEDWTPEDSGAVTVASEVNYTQLPLPLSLTPSATLVTQTQRTFNNPMRSWMVTPSGAFNGFLGLASRVVTAFTPNRRVEFLQPTGSANPPTTTVAERIHGPAVSQAVGASGVSNIRAFGARPKILSFASQPIIIAQSTSPPMSMNTWAATIVPTAE